MRIGFDEFIFDSDTKELLRQARPVPLSPKAFQLLEILIDSRPKALSKSAVARSPLAEHVRGRGQFVQLDWRGPARAR